MPPPVPPSARRPRASATTTSPRSKRTLERLVDFDLHQFRRDPFQRRRRERRHRQFRLFRQHHAPDRAGACHRQRLAAARLSCDRDRRRVLSGTAASCPTRPCNGCSTARPRQDTLAFQVDLWSARGELPRNLIEAELRQKEIQFSSRTRAGDRPVQENAAASSARSQISLEKLPRDVRQTPEAEAARRGGRRKVYNIIQLIYHARKYEGGSKTTSSHAEPWRSTGVRIQRRGSHAASSRRCSSVPNGSDGVFTFDLAVQGRE